MRKLILSVLSLVCVAAMAQTKYSHYYQNLPCAVEEVKEVVIPDYTVTLTDFGAVGDGVTDCTSSIQDAINACLPGDVVLISEGALPYGSSVPEKRN